MAAQSISNRYIRLEDLRSLLRGKFGEGNFKIREADNSYEIEAPVTLSESRNDVIMDNLRDSIEKLRYEHQNSAGRYFIPEAALFELFSETNIRGCVKALDVTDHEREELAQVIIKGARKCLSVLLLIGYGKGIVGFFKHDSMQNSWPDDRFPYTAEPLQRALGVDPSDIMVKRFLETQWAFITPIFKPHLILREFDPSIILPYVSETSAGSGSMGDAYLVDIHPQCHQLPIGNHQVVRKELRQSKDESIASFMLELRNLALLAHLNHPNIVKLYCSYVHNFPVRRCNLVFEVADGGTLAELLDGRDKGLNMETHQLLLGLADLASAINAVHNFTSETLKLQLTGCHHDLAPRNILIRGETLLLADFGLSSFRNPSQDSLTMFKDVRGSYVAPECQILNNQDRIESTGVTRASDIWSFGCILSEVLTYTMRGSLGVQQFRDSRSIWFVGEIEWQRFHAGPGNPNPAIERWLHDLETEGQHEAWILRLTKLIRWTLAMEPRHRPTSSQILRDISGIAMIFLSSSIEQAWDQYDLMDTTKGKYSILEKIRFRSWCFALNQLLECPDIAPSSNEQLDSSLATKLLKELRHTLINSRDEDDTIKGYRQRTLRSQTTALVQTLPPRYATVFREYLVEQAMQASDMNDLEILCTGLKEGNEQDIGTLLAVRRLTILTDKGNLIPRHDLMMDRQAITIRSELGFNALASLQCQSEEVIVEWLVYDASWADEAIGSRLQNRLASMASLLNNEAVSALPCTLHCRGLFHAPERNSFGLVYNVPTNGVIPRTLYQLLEEKEPDSMGKKGAARFRPPLEYRLRLSSELCRCIHTLHGVKWLHRNIHSMNIVCFQPIGVRDAEAAQEARLMGLGTSREDTHDSFTHGHDDKAQLRNYHHPRYLAGERYCPEFDYYSLGMVLLEVGLWTTLSKLAKRFGGTNDEQFRRAIIDKYVTQLDLTMGTSYMNAVRWCLECEGRGEQRRDVLHVKSDTFKARVMDCITKIC